MSLPSVHSRKWLGMIRSDPGRGKAGASESVMEPQTHAYALHMHSNEHIKKPVINQFNYHQMFNITSKNVF